MEAEAQLRSALADARTSGSDYDVAATIGALESIRAADQDMLRDRDEILERLKIVRLPVPAPGVRA